MVIKTKLLKSAGLTGRLKHNSSRINKQAITEFLHGKIYWTLSLNASKLPKLSHKEATNIVAKGLGISSHKFSHSKTAYIAPGKTVEQIDLAFEYLQEQASKGKTALFATGHPGSMLGFYQALAHVYRAWGGEVFTLDVPLQTISNMWLDWVGDCMAVTDEGSLLHTHLGLNMPKLLETGNIDLVVADHGFAVAAINAQIPVVAFFDTDDPAIPLAASIQPNIIAVPLNDNQKNNATAEAFRVVLEKYLD